MNRDQTGHPLFLSWENVLDRAVTAVGSEGESLSDPASRGAVESLLQFQRQWEEGVLFPRLARYFAGGGPVPVMEAEHRDLERRWAALDPEDDNSRAAFAKALRLHARKESLTLLQVARVRLSRREWEALLDTAASRGLLPPEA